MKIRRNSKNVKVGDKFRLYYNNGEFITRQITYVSPNGFKCIEKTSQQKHFSSVEYVRPFICLDSMEYIGNINTKPNIISRFISNIKNSKDETIDEEEPVNMFTSIIDSNPVKKEDSDNVVIQKQDIQPSKKHHHIKLNDIILIKIKNKKLKEENKNLKELLKKCRTFLDGNIEWSVLTLLDLETVLKDVDFALSSNKIKRIVMKMWRDGKKCGEIGREIGRTPQFVACYIDRLIKEENEKNITKN